MEIGDCVLLLEGHTGAVTDLAVAQAGSILVTASADHTARVWGLDKGQCMAVLQGHTASVTAVVVDEFGRFAVTGSADGTGRVWDLHSGQCAHVLRGHGGGVMGSGKDPPCVVRPLLLVVKLGMSTCALLHCPLPGSFVLDCKLQAYLLHLSTCCRNDVQVASCHVTLYTSIAGPARFGQRPSSDTHCAAADTHYYKAVKSSSRCRLTQPDV